MRILSVFNAGADTDRFLVQDGTGAVKFRTGAEVAADIGAANIAASQLKHTVKAAVALTKGQAVYVSGADGTNMLVSKSSNVSESTSTKTMGLIDRNLAINDMGEVITEGLLAGLNTSTATIGDPVWLGVDGNLLYGLANKPVAPAHMVFIGIVTRVQTNNGEIFVKVQNGFELEELHNVLITGTPVDKAVIQYDTASGLWKNSTLGGVTASTGTAGQVAYFTDATTQAGSNNLFWDATNSRLGVGTNAPAVTLDVRNGVNLYSFSASFPSAHYLEIISNSNTDGYVNFRRVGAQNGPAAYYITGGNARFSYDGATGNTILGAYTNNPLLFFTNSLERARIDASGNLGIGTTTPSERLTIGGRINFGSFSTDVNDYSFYVTTGGNGGTTISSAGATSIIFRNNAAESARINGSGRLILGGGTTDSGQKLQVVGTAYFSDSVGIGNSGTAASSIRISKALATGNTIGIYMDSQIQSTLSNVAYFQSEASTSATAITVTHLRHYFATAPSFGAGSTVTNQYGFAVQGSTLINATNNYGFWGDIAAGTNRWNLYMGGTASNFLSGDLRVNETAASNAMIFASTTGRTNVVGIRVGGSATQVTSFGFFSNQTIGSANSTEYVSFNSSTDIASGTYTIPSVTSYRAQSGTKPVTVTITNMYGFFAESGLIQGTNNYGFYGNIAAATGRWNLYMNGTAANYLNGELLLGSTSNTGEKLQVTGTIKVTGNFSGGGIVSGTEFRLNNNSFQRIALGDAGGGFAGGYNIDYSSGSVVSHAATGAIAGYRYASTGSISFFTGTSQAAGTTATERMRLDASGNLGLGTTSPLYKLDVQGTSGTVAIRALSNVAGDILYYATGTVTGSLNAFTSAINATGSVAASLLNANTATGSAFLDINVTSTSTGDPYLSLTTSGATNWSIGIDNSDSDKLKIGPTSNPSIGTPSLTIDTTGNVGIGTITPTHPLNIYTTVADTGILLDSNTNPSFIIKRAGVERLKLTATGAIGTINGLGNGLVFQTDSTERARFDTSGNLGIGTTTPNVRLDVNGSLDLRNAFQGYARLQPSAGNTSQARLSIRLKPVDTAEVTLGSFTQDGSFGLGGNITDIISMAGAYFSVASTGRARLNSYGGGSFTGTVAYNLAVDASGNIIETAGGVVDGSGTANYIPKWSDANTLGNSVIIEGTRSLGINTPTPVDFGAGTYNLHLHDDGIPLIQLTNSTTGQSSSVGMRIQANGNDLLFINSQATGVMRWNANGAERLRLFSTGNFGINTGATDSGQRLQVIGDTLLKGSGNTTGTNALLVENSDGNDLFIARNDGSIFLTANTGARIYPSIALSGVEIGATGLAFDGRAVTRTAVSSSFWFFVANNSTAAVQSLMNFGGSFIPTSGTASWNSTLISTTINQTGGANGITRGLYVNPTLTAAADWRSIEWSNNSGWGLYGAGTADNYLAGRLGIGTTPTYTLDILAATGTEPISSPVDNYAARIRRTYTNNNASSSARRYGVWNEITYTGNQAYTNATGHYNYVNYQNTNASSIIGASSSLIEPNATAAATTLYGNQSLISLAGTITNATLYRAFNIAVSSGTITNVRHFQAESTGTTTTITNQYGFIAESTITGATNNYGFYGNIAAATGRWNLYMNGTADNYMAGSLGIGSTSLTGYELRISGNITGAVAGYGVSVDSQIQSDVNSSVTMFDTNPSTQAATFNIGSLIHFQSRQGTLGANSTISNQYGFLAQATLTGASNNYGFFGNIAAGTNRWNFYAGGTALNYFNGNTLIGSTTDSGEKLQVTGTAKITGTLSVGDTSTTNIVNITGGAASNAELRLINGTTRQVRFASRGDISQILLDADTWDMGIRTVGSKFLYFATNGTERVRIDAIGNVGIGATTVNASAKLQVDSTTSGFLPPRMTAAQRAAIATPAEGLIIFQTDGVVGLYLYINSAWKSLAIVN